MDNKFIPRQEPATTEEEFSDIKKVEAVEITNEDREVIGPIKDTLLAKFNSGMILNHAKDAVKIFIKDAFAEKGLPCTEDKAQALMLEIQKEALPNIPQNKLTEKEIDEINKKRRLEKAEAEAKAKAEGFDPEKIIEEPKKEN